MVVHIVQFVDPSGEERPSFDVLTQRQLDSWLDYAKRNGVHTHTVIKTVELTDEEIAKIHPDAL